MGEQLYRTGLIARWTIIQDWVGHKLLLKRFTIIQDWAHAEAARMGTIIQGWKMVDTYTQEPVSERCCWEGTTRVESCVKMVLSARHYSSMLRGGHSHLMASDSLGLLIAA